jgi:3(or 17)beta-hydroxysteroid dehydrogenase
LSSLSGRVAVITGGGRGIGKAVAMRLAAAGAKVFVTDLDLARAEEVTNALVVNGGEAEAIHHDVADERGWMRIAELLTKRNEDLDVLVNNAGVTIAKYIEETTVEDWRLMMSVNLDSVFLGVKALLPIMKESAKRTPAGGSIVNMSSVSGIIGTPVLAAYTTSKAGVRYLSKSIALDFARKGYRIRVNSVHPGVIEGESSKLLYESRVRNGLSPTVEDARRDWIANYPLGRAGTVDDVAEGVLYLASDASSYITGTELVIDGGLSAQ